jgi:hypothetical protein
MIQTPPEPVRGIDVAQAFDLGFEWAMALFGHVFDSRDVARTLTLESLDGLGINPHAVDGYACRSTGIVQAKAEIKRALLAAAEKYPQEPAKAGQS